MKYKAFFYNFEGLSFVEKIKKMIEQDLFEKNLALAQNGPK